MASVSSTVDLAFLPSFSMVGVNVPKPSSFTGWPWVMSSFRQLTMFSSTSWARS